MKALQQIIQRVAKNPAQPWALATLVQTRGSTYRKAGARLLVDPDGATLGFLTGGCLEEEIGRQGRNVIRDGSPVLLSFDTRRLYGCDGLLKILVEPLPAAGENGNLITNVGRSLRDREVCRVRTCFEGTKLGSEILPSDILLTERAGVFIETLALPIRLLLFGTGPEIEPITHLATTLGWMVERFSHPSELAQDFRSDTQTAAVVMNHNFGRDLLSLHRLLPLQLRYVGLLGPKKRHAEILAQLSEYAVFDFNRAVDNLFAPAGLDIGSEAPEEIALSIVAEVAAVLSGRVGGFLRERGANIHATATTASGEAA
jgi:xanthine/CO dehydrogenase XdhC/CoxF family maturation factor